MGSVRNDKIEVKMIPKTAKMRVARPTDNLSEITQMYVNGLGFELLGGCPRIAPVARITRN